MGMVCISNYIYQRSWDLITYPWPNSVNLKKTKRPMPIDIMERCFINNHHKFDPSRPYRFSKLMSYRIFAKRHLMQIPNLCNLKNSVAIIFSNLYSAFTIYQLTLTFINCDDSMDAQGSILQYKSLAGNEVINLWCPPSSEPMLRTSRKFSEWIHVVQFTVAG